jgi:hypothetical protein
VAQDLSQFAKIPAVHHVPRSEGASNRGSGNPRYRSRLAPGSGGKNRSSPRITGYRLNSTANSGHIGAYRTLPRFSLARTTISSSRRGVAGFTPLGWVTQGRRPEVRKGAAILPSKRFDQFPTTIFSVCAPFTPSTVNVSGTTPLVLLRDQDLLLVISEEREAVQCGQGRLVVLSDNACSNEAFVSPEMVAGMIKLQRFGGGAAPSPDR